MSDPIPRCEHGHIILGCHFDDCVAQTLYLIEQATILDEWFRRQQDDARKALGLPSE